MPRLSLAGCEALLRVIDESLSPSPLAVRAAAQLRQRVEPARAREVTSAPRRTPMPENPALDPRALRSCMAWGLLRRGVVADKARRQSYEVAMALRMDLLLERPCHQLSFREQGRVALAGLLGLEIAVLRLDEPTAGLDPVAAHELCTLVEESIRQTSATCVWATHDLNALPPPATRAALLRDRRLIFDGSTAKGISKPLRIGAGFAVSEREWKIC